ncbi:M10 family metallopeptidase [Pseudotabrizicola formosa]|uniref:M10 family metallopeptidase n=1 Tax=Pseudotabrizicola formosa TaxID=2030009 RepID=UPI000CD119C0|nr:M10 family metallopeptidase [Pseudotabrizicola formosa]
MAKDSVLGPGLRDACMVIRHAGVEIGDVPASVATSARVAVGDTFTGSLTAGDRDWVAVGLTAGQAYVFTAFGTGGGVGLSDPQLVLRDVSGTSVAFNDDAEADNATSMLRFTPLTSGTYFLDVGGTGGAQGQYTLRTATDIFTIAQIASQLTESGWGVARSALTLEAIRTGLPVTVDLSALSAQGQDVARMALEIWSVTTGVVFAETAAAGATILFDDDDPRYGSGLYAFAGPNAIYPDGTYGSAKVTVSTGWLDAYGASFGSYGYFTYLHELGHALGLGHAGFYNGSARYGVDNHYRNDSTQMTIMSYFDVAANSFVEATYFQPITPMAADLAAIASLYPGLPAVFAGDTVWGAQSNVSGRLGTSMAVMFDGLARPAWMDPAEPFGLTIVDHGGWDRMAFGATHAAQLIDMRQGGVSDVYGARGTVVVALGSVIEEAHGGQGADTIHGNDADNLIRGHDGADFIIGNAGHDTLFGGGGDDIIWASLGNDSVDAGSGADEVWGGPGNDTLKGCDGNDTLGGAGGNDRLSGDAGDDRLWGGAGRDLLYGGSGGDELAGGAGNDTVYGGDGHDTVFGAMADDLIFGEAGDDLIWAGQGNDTVYGGDGNDTLAPGGGDDVVTGGAGADVFVFHANNGTTQITDFLASDGDLLHLSAWLWQAQFGALSVEQVELSFGRLDGDGFVLLEFEAANTWISLVGLGDLDGLHQAIVII